MVRQNVARQERQTNYREKKKEESGEITAAAGGVRCQSIIGKPQTTWQNTD